MFRIDQKVVCVDVSGSAIHVLKLNAIYTVKYIRADHSILGIDCPPINSAPGACGWKMSRFRPVVERKTDISIFTAMLTPSPVTVDVMNVANHAREIVR